MNASLLCKLCTIQDRERGRTKFSKIEELKFPRLMLTILDLLRKIYLLSRKALTLHFLHKLFTIHDRERRNTKLRKMGEL